MSILEWKKVNLFDLVELPFTKLKNIKDNISAYCCKSTTKTHYGESNITMVFCEQNGLVHVTSTSMECIVFKSQSHPIKLCALTSNELLVTATQDDNFAVRILIYDLRRLTKKQGAPVIVTAIMPAKSSVTCIQADIVDDKLLVLGVGFEKGDILLHYGKINRDLSANSRHYTIGVLPINSIHFDIKLRYVDMPTCNVFVTCLEGIYCFVLNEKGLVEPKLMLDNDKNEQNQCCTMRQAANLEHNHSEDDALLVVGRDDAIYCFTRDGRGPCYAIDGEKIYLSWMRHYLIAIVRNKKLIFGGRSSSMLIVIDTENRIIVLYKQIDDLFGILSGRDDYYIITKVQNANETFEYNMYKLEEHKITQKVRILIENSMFVLAQRLLERDGYDCSEEAAFIRYQLGNHLMLKGDISRATDEYLQTIGVIKPYDVVSKFLVSRHNKYLIKYLRALVNSDQSTEKHKRLLQSCIDRNDLSLSTVPKHENRNPQTKLTYFKHPSKGSTNFVLYTNIWQQLERENNLAEIYEENEILNFFLECSRGLLLLHPGLVETTVKALVLNRKIKHILRFLSILSENTEFCVQILTEIMQKHSNCNQKLYFYLLNLFLGLWQKKKLESQDVLEFLTNGRLHRNKALIICRLYLFASGINHYQSNRRDAELSTGGHSILNQYVSILRNSYPELALLFETSPRSFLMLLKSAFGNKAIYAFHMKQFFTEKTHYNFLDTTKDTLIIKDLNKQIEDTSSMISRYKYNPIEFRNTSCDICRQSLKFPSVYFNCQHSFHKECLNYNAPKTSLGAVLCTVCCGGDTRYVEDLSKNSCVPDEPGEIISAISKTVASGIVRAVSGNGRNLKTHQAIDERTSTNNPFDI